MGLQPPFNTNSMLNSAQKSSTCVLLLQLCSTVMDSCNLLPRFVPSLWYLIHVDTVNTFPGFWFSSIVTRTNAAGVYGEQKLPLDGREFDLLWVAMRLMKLSNTVRVKCFIQESMDPCCAFDGSLGGLGADLWLYLGVAWFESRSGHR
jgi:hypothetical protein